MAQLLFYEKPVPLNKDIHRTLCIKTADNLYGFSRVTNSVLLAGVEFAHAAKEYCIVFTKAGDLVMPVALLGLRNDENLYVDHENRWNAHYIPAFIRRYPFILAESGQGDAQKTVCIDETFIGFNDKEGRRLFDDTGESTEFLTSAIKFLQDYQGQYRRTEVFVNRLKDLDLFTELNAQAQLPNGQKVHMGGLLGVDENKLLQLEKNKALELFRSGELSWVYAHLLSMSNMQRLGERLVKKEQSNA
ncbi:MAG: SapC family protein [Magnetococcales bacterium]|nr:SapC family protein [Magnetococcales bacterium]MBF0150880.1 SapC family protein [Magnetococcales bacterium]MBF0172679.1 SapC family protein [Magnetococcales bacterium]MBF0348028.1 SapC family protein [Magnetococcales bacterium]MBF0629391.1 SapC family protein [Magnetococcales bacterium]